MVLRCHSVLPLLLLPALLLGCTGSEGPSPAPAPSETAGAAQPDPHALEVAEPRELRSRDGQLLISWSPVGGSVPVNKPLEVDVTVRRAAPPEAGRSPGELIEDAEVSMTCFMPAHGHGMLREPRTEHLGGGVYRVRGLLLHMGGEWAISISASIDGLASTADDTITL